MELVGAVHSSGTGQPLKVTAKVLLPRPLQPHCVPFPGPQPFKQSGTGIPNYHGRSHQFFFFLMPGGNEHVKLGFLVEVGSKQKNTVVICG